MRPTRGNSGQQRRSNFTRSERLGALREFYMQYGNQYPKAASDFFLQNPR